MSIFWSSWITILSIGCWLFILGVLIFVLKYKPEVQEDGTTGHAYDGIKEYDKPLPKWWLVIFFGSIVWGVLYWVLFPALLPGIWHGASTVEVDGETKPWTSVNELYSNLETNNKIFTDNFEQNILPDATAVQQLKQLSDLQAEQRRQETPSAELQTQIDENINKLAPYVVSLSQDPKALMLGQRLFLQNCALCHGSNATGATGYPNLTDNDWLYGGKAEDILTTVHNGRIGGMPAWRDDIGEDGVRAASEYVLSLSPSHGDVKGKSYSNGELDQTLVKQGSAIFQQKCALCHGEDGKGMHSTGAPNLTDDIWLYGGQREVVRNTVRHGRAGVMPAWESKLGNERIMLIAAYIYSLRDGGQPLPDSTGN
ncbi:cytochrome-c oxidase, cbb3-type subunit III [Psychrobacter sp. I-STPA6b]|uniref:cytochrome-c oxidase, cbb3-type subunit III n=1 Tax=Psychrobacter sp. I-STPA6b TaxID=2585718 RepID=UPI001D0C3F8F|nr:cytochrome-c oxidase, cbb3-type subunit III [Psychrobacter sp. I-STPA6b]